MDRALIMAAIVIALGGAYVLFFTRPDAPRPQEGTVLEVRVTTARVQEHADFYTIDAEYPQFDILGIDTHIRNVIEGAIAQFKSDAMLGPPPPDSAVTHYEFISRFDSVYANADVVSVKLIVSTYMGGAHGISFVHGLNFDRKTGKELSLDDALSLIGLSLQDVSRQAKTHLERTLGPDVIAPEGADPTPENYSTFLIDAETVAFVFQVYQVAPYAAGPQEVRFARQ